ncbi:hypothetical protein B0H63DRAFT_485409 [Podospora didyma]|uniref:Uncharacterized protein n=1 Tax=Podospora didyma TaxID=330526 RepID=A0AAE0K9J5_9PEZI|nr:hypothetical protein B0H63DRAFT_485409 [Podospora didyma]
MKLCGNLLNDDIPNPLYCPLHRHSAQHRLHVVPCTFWGHWLLNMHGCTIHHRSAAEALGRVNGLTPCHDPEKCRTTSPERPTPPPTFHAHLANPELTAGLYPQSDTLWFLPPLPDSLLNPTEQEMPSDSVLASDEAALPPWRPGRGLDLYKSSGDLIVVLKSHVMLEAFGNSMRGTVARSLARSRWA